MTLQASADLVRRGDPDRFAAAMAAPIEARKVLFPLYAFNLEVARAPWVASEPMIGEMRLQWWRDALDEIATGGPVRRHEVTTPLAEILDPSGARALDTVVTARRWDLYTEPFEDEAHFHAYVGAGATLMWTAARLLGAASETEDAIRRTGHAAALARYVAAVPDLEARGRVPLIDGRPDAVADLAREALNDLPGARDLNRRLPPTPRAALLEAWQARPLLTLALNHPERVAQGTLRLSEFRKRLGLLKASL